MTTKELRLDNYLLSNYHKDGITRDLLLVYRIEEGGISTYEVESYRNPVDGYGGSCGGIEDFYPIPITLEILIEVCGFKGTMTSGEDDCITLKAPNSFGLDCIYHIHNAEIVCYEYDGVVIFSIANNLHQLQNLYFALTGDEIEINERKLIEILQRQQQTRKFILEKYKQNLGQE